MSAFRHDTEPLSPYQLGATLYMPATRTDIDQVVLNNKVPGLSSLVICLEDAILAERIPAAIQNVSHILTRIGRATPTQASTRPLVFIRPRHPEMARWLIEHLDLNQVHGFVLPKFTLASLDEWATLLEPTSLYWMPTLESVEVFDSFEMQQLAKTLAQHPLRERILAIRIGGNDLMNLLSLRRQRNLTLYQTPLAQVIQNLVCQFAPRDFSLTAPVCEIIDDPALLSAELEQDIAHGLVGKTAIHPSQVQRINRALTVNSQEHQDALNILNASQAVFQAHGAMCEPATQHRWAERVLIRARYYGISDAGPQYTTPPLPQQPPQGVLNY